MEIRLIAPSFCIKHENILLPTIWGISHCNQCLHELQENALETVKVVGLVERMVRTIPLDRWFPIKEKIFKFSTERGISIDNAMFGFISSRALEKGMTFDEAINQVREKGYNFLFL